ncbi:MAG: hypothetical protein J5715_10410 [Clostridiales bacterium]|nr:hypothetical protein [Clostridiales bacterium]
MRKTFYTRFRLATRGKAIFWIPLIFLLAVIFSYFVFLTPDEGGIATFMSMAIIALVGYYYGPVPGFITSILFGAAMFFLHSQMPTEDVIARFVFTLFGGQSYWGEVADYVIGYGLMGITGFFAFDKDLKAKRKGLMMNKNFIIGFGIAALLRFIEGIWNCYYFYDLKKGSVWANLGYSTWYSFWYIGIEVILSLIIILLPPVSSAIRYIGECATDREYRSNTNYL